MPLGLPACNSSCTGGIRFACRLAGCFEQRANILFRMATAKDSIPGYQEVRTCLDDLGYRVVSHPTVDFDFKCQPHLLAQFGQFPDLF